MTFPGPTHSGEPFNRQDFPVDYDPALATSGDVPVFVQDDRLANIELSGNPTGGSFVLKYVYSSAKDLTVAIPHDATALAVQTALEGCSRIGTGQVLVTGPDGGPWQIRILNAERGALGLESDTLTPTAAQVHVGGDMLRQRRMELRHRRTWPSVSGLVAPLIAPTLSVAGGFAPGTHVLTATRVIASKSGVLTNIWAPIIVPGGGQVLAAIYTTTTPRTLAWTGTAATLASVDANTWKDLGSPMLPVDEGQHLDLAIIFSNATAQCGRGPSLANGALANLPDALFTAPGGATGRLSWTHQATSFAAPASVEETNMANPVATPLLIAQIR